MTGTDTGVGKTLVAAGLAALLRARGVDVGVMKPVETGCRLRAGELVPLDALALRAASGASDSLDLIVPYRFRDPLAPMVAAGRAGQRIDVGAIQERFDLLRRRHHVVLVEGAGGLLVPLTARVSFLDLARGMGLPLVVVIGSRLGALNHARLTLAVARAGGLPVAGAILNRPGRDRSLAARTNGTALRRLLPAPLLTEIPYLGPSPGRPTWRDPRLQRLLARAILDLFPTLLDGGRQP